ncbi:hypothetical protein J6590_031293 [Homalodisca vitripennis]|nr:hypothetical protein J6590_031293 [Homalodisca vitripennis]
MMVEDIQSVQIFVTVPIVNDDKPLSRVKCNSAVYPLTPSLNCTTPAQKRTEQSEHIRHETNNQSYNAACPTTEFDSGSFKPLNRLTEPPSSHSTDKVGLMSAYLSSGYIFRTKLTVSHITLAQLVM